jgi:hypothetical protein
VKKPGAPCSASLYRKDGLGYVDLIERLARGGVEALVFGQRAGFRLAWIASCSWLRVSAGRTNHELPPSGPDAAVHQAAIIRLPSSVASSVVPILERLRQNNADHYYYPPDTIHVTIRKLGRFVPHDPGAAARLGELRHIVGSHPGFDLSMWGLNLSPTTAFA